MSSKVLSSSTSYDATKLWVDEEIWGHRFYNDQTPWMLLLEFMAVFYSRYTSGCALNEKTENGVHEKIHYNIPKSIQLRELIFNAPYVQHIVETESADEKRWDAFSKSNERSQELRERFRNFSEMNQVIKLFQNASVEAHRNRRWTSRFLFPYGPDCIYSDLGKKNNPDRRFFARGGELLYLMLCRCEQRTELAKEISRRFFSYPDAQWSGLVKAFIPAGYRYESDLIKMSIGYLPYEEHGTYDVLAQDWLTILRLKVPYVNLLEPLMRISALHMLLYMLQRSLDEIGEKDKPKFVIDIPSPNKSNMLELSKRNFDKNRSLSRKAIFAHIDKAKDDKRWKRALKSSHGSRSSEAREYLQERFKYSEWEESTERDPDNLIQELKEYALKRHNQHVYKVHREWGREIGLVVARRGVGTWYSPTDDLIKTLVITNVNKRDEYRQFLKKLYDKYGFVIGVQEAKEAYGRSPIDERDLDENSRRLEHRLKTLGLLNRLSDDCAYVENPFTAHG